MTDTIWWKLRLAYSGVTNQMATDKTEAPKRAATFAPGIGANLDSIKDTDVVVTHVSVNERSFGGEDRAIVIITLDDGRLFHAWSDSLAQKISEIPNDAYPLVFKFVRTPTRSYPTGVWTFE